MITYHHIGGRNGTYPLPLKNGILLENFHLVLYDADMNCFSHMEQAKQGSWGKISVHPYCIGGKTGKGTFNLNFHPTTNSLYPFNKEYASYSYVNYPCYGEYIIGDACKPMASVDLDLFSLEDALKIANIPSIDFLSLDVQGAEFDILEGAKSLLQKSCLGIQLEAEFAEFYRGQKTFSEINALLEGLGFELIDLESFGRCAPMSLPIGYRGLEQTLSAEAIYVKKLDYLVKNGDIESIYKAALFNLVYKKLGLCLKFLSKAIEMEGEENFKPELAPLYKKFLREIWELYKKDKLYALPRLSQLFSNEALKNYYKTGESSYLLKEVAIKDHLKQLLLHVKNLADKESSPLEVLLKNYDLHEVAEAVKKTRLFDSECLFGLAELSLAAN